MTKLDLIKMSIKEIFFFWSESQVMVDAFEESQPADLDLFIEACTQGAIEADGCDCYLKTKFRVTFQNGIEKVLRIDLEQDESCPLELISHYIPNS